MTPVLDDPGNVLQVLGQPQLIGEPEADCDGGADREGEGLVNLFCPAGRHNAPTGCFGEAPLPQ